MSTRNIQQQYSWISVRLLIPFATKILLVKLEKIWYKRNKLVQKLFATKKTKNKSV